LFIALQFGKKRNCQFGKVVFEICLTGCKKMSAKRYFLLGGALGLVSGALALLVRPALLKTARIMSVTSGAPAVASVALTYRQGVPPVSVIVDVRGSAGGAGSATVDGRQQFVEVPISGPVGDDYLLTATASYRVFGTLWTKVREFAEG
jgi:hypothetical protein